MPSEISFRKFDRHQAESHRGSELSSSAQATLPAWQQGDGIGLGAYPGQVSPQGFSQAEPVLRCGNVDAAIGVAFRDVGAELLVVLLRGIEYLVSCHAQVFRP